MITNYQILADSSCDLPFSLARSLGVSYAPLRVQFQGAEYENFLDGDPRSRLDIKAFYSALRTGTPTSTTAVNPEGWSALMTPVLEAGQDILPSWLPRSWGAGTPPGPFAWWIPSALPWDRDS